MFSYKDWLSRYGSENCSGCSYNNSSRAHCSYHGKFHCYRYELYLKDSLRDDYPILFDDDDIV